MTVEVILPVYNPKSWVKQAIHSVINQSYQDWHLTIIDDASERSNEKNIKSHIQNYEEKITYIKLKRNVGAAGARNIAAKKSEKDYITFIDQDDRYPPDRLEKQVNAISNTDAKLLHGNILHIDESGSIIGEGRANKIRNNIDYINMGNKELAQELFDINSIRIGTVIIDRDAFLDVGCLDSTIFGGEEPEFWVRFVNHYKIAHIEEILYEKRTHKEQVGTTMKVERLQGRLIAIDKMLNEYNFLRDESDKKRRSLVRQIAKREIMNKHPKKAKRILKRELSNYSCGLKENFLLLLAHLGLIGRFSLSCYLKMFKLSL